ncbi:MAG: thioredoxin-dependent thiol peroxidase [Candidatus Eisenbacteria bacterium]|nr:thioredoxin-dependent thiol peroxidase [Candidatus Eisenbacteria bacterium]
MPVVAGRPAPAFSLQDAEGRAVKLADFAGRNLILYFYPKDDTPGCTREACGFRDGWSELKKLKVAVVGVSADGAESHRKFADKYSLPFTLLSDPDRSVMKRYGAWGEKVSYGKATVGVIRSTVWIGPDGKVRRLWQPVRDAAAHPEQVLAALREG